MKVSQVLKYIGIFILTTFLLFWGDLLYINRGNSYNPNFDEVLLYYVWGVLIIVSTIFKKIKEILGFKNDNENSYRNN